MPAGTIVVEAITSAIGSITEGAANIISKFKADPTKVAEAESDLAKLKIDAQLKAIELTNSLEEIRAKELETVNETMREESKSEHWAQWLWRPMVGFTFCAILVNNYIIVPYFKKYGVEVIAVPDQVYTAIMIILGAASAGRGLKQWQEAKNSSDK